MLGSWKENWPDHIILPREGGERGAMTDGAITFNLLLALGYMKVHSEILRVPA